MRQADVTLTKLRTYLRLSKDLELLKINQYEHASRMVDEIGRLLGGWINGILKSQQQPPPTRKP